MTSDKNEKSVTLMVAVSIGVGAMVGAGIFTLLGEAGSIAGSLVYFSFVIGGLLALLSGYSYAKLGARYPSSGGIVEYLVQSFGSGIVAGGISVLYYFSLIISLALLAKGFGYYGEALGGQNTPKYASTILSVGLVFLLLTVNIIGTETVGKLEKTVVTLNVLILIVFTLIGFTTFNPSIVSQGAGNGLSAVFFSVAITFFSYTGFGLITNAAEHMQNPSKTLPRAIFISILLVTILYIGLALVVFGNLTLSEIEVAKKYALAEAARPALGQAGFVVMGIVALLCTASAFNATLFGATNIAYSLAKNGELPKIFEREGWHMAPEGLYITAFLAIIMVLFVDLAGIAALGSATVITLYCFVHAGHLRLIRETGASRVLIILALLSKLFTLGLFFAYSFQSNPRISIYYVLALLSSFLLEYFLKKYSKKSVASRMEHI